MNNSVAATQTTPAPLVRLLEAQVRGLRPSTKRHYHKAWAQLSQRLGVSTQRQLMEALCGQGRAECHITLLDWQSAMVEAGLSPSTVNGRIAAVQFLLKVAYDAEVIDWAVNIKGLKPEPYRDTRGPSKEDFTKMLATASTRDRAVLLCIYTLRLRRAEVASLNVGSVNGEVMTVMLKGRDVPALLNVPPVTIQAIDLYLSTRVPQSTEPMFATRTGRRFTDGQIYLMVRRVAKRAGIDASVSPHRLLHSAVNEALEVTNGNIAKVAAWAGHKSPATTLIYYDHLQDAQGKVANALGEGIDTSDEQR